MKIFLVAVSAALLALSGSSTHASPEDRDSDGLMNDAEVQIYGTDPNNADSDWDGILDGVEIQQKTDPRSFNGTTYTAAQLAALDGLKRIDVDLSEQRLRYYAGDTLLGVIPVSTGIRSMPTPLGSYAVRAKVPVVHYRGIGYNYPNTKWNLRFRTGYYIHGTYWHNDFGKRPRSHGCINVSYKDMPLLYAFANVGTRVTVHR